MTGFHTLKAKSSKRSAMMTRKSIKELYDENRLLYAERKAVESHTYDPKVAQLFLEEFYSRRKNQMKVRFYLMILSCLLTGLIVFGIVKAINTLLSSV